MIVSCIWTIPLGVRAAVRPNGLLGSRGDLPVRVSVPAFWLGLLLIFLLYFLWPVLPAPLGRLGSGLDAPATITGFYTVDALLGGNPAWHGKPYAISSSGSDPRDH